MVSSAPRLQGVGRQLPRPSPSAREPATLSKRQLEVARLVGEGLSNASIAQQLVIAPGTVANHVQHILVKLGMRTRVQIAIWAMGRGLVDPGGLPSVRHESAERSLTL